MLAPSDEDILEGTMEGLLTGRTRASGFSVLVMGGQTLRSSNFPMRLGAATFPPIHTIEFIDSPQFVVSSTERVKPIGTQYSVANTFGKDGISLLEPGRR